MVHNQISFQLIHNTLMIQNKFVQNKHLQCLKAEHAFVGCHILFLPMKIVPFKNSKFHQEFCTISLKG
jgi:hypothetical protein